jgi:hypothetical protein
MGWVETLPSTEVDAFSELADALRSGADEQALLSRHYTRRARELTELQRPGDERNALLDVAISYSEPSSHWWEMVLITLGLGEIHELELEPAEAHLAAVEAHFWHELGHELHSGWHEPPESPLETIASNLLEDLRIEPQLVSHFGSPVRLWLRHNLALSHPDVQAIAAAAKRNGRATTLTVVAGRWVSGVIDDAEHESVLAALNLDADEAHELLELWTAYAELDDDETGEERAHHLARALAAHLPDDLPSRLG